MVTHSATQYTHQQLSPIDDAQLCSMADRYFASARRQKFWTFKNFHTGSTNIDAEWHLTAFSHGCVYTKPAWNEFDWNFSDNPTALAAPATLSQSIQWGQCNLSRLGRCWTNIKSKKDKIFLITVQYDGNISRWKASQQLWTWFSKEIRWYLSISRMPISWRVWLKRSEYTCESEGSGACIRS